MPQARLTTNRIKQVITLLVVGFIVVYVLNRWTTKDTFCTVEDTLYQTIRSHAQEWATHFSQPSQTLVDPVLPFSTEDGQRFTALKHGDNQFFVFTETTTPHTYFEYKGYIYSPTDMPNLGNYQITDLGENIYCYQLDR